MADIRGKAYGLPVGQYVVNQLGGRWTPEKARFFNAWAQAENTNASFNPFATTRRGYPGEAQFNSVGVKNYPNLGVGRQATLDTIRNGYYNDIVDLLKDPNSTAEQLAAAVAASPWGTGSGVLRVLGAKGATEFEQTKSAATFSAQKQFLNRPFVEAHAQEIAEVNAQITAINQFSARLTQQTNAMLTPSQGWLDTLSRMGAGSKRIADTAARFQPMQVRQSPLVPISEPEITDADPGQPVFGSRPIKGGSFINQALGGTKYTDLGGPEAHGARPLGNWQSDNAWDLGVPVGTPVYATADGIIGDQIGTQSARPADGERLTLTGRKNAYWYGHLSKIVVKPGQRVKKGQLLGYSGESQNGVAHLHLGVERL